jgi:hypothetical protein
MRCSSCRVPAADCLIGGRPQVGQPQLGGLSHSAPGKRSPWARRGDGPTSRKCAHLPVPAAIGATDGAQIGRRSLPSVKAREVTVAAREGVSDPAAHPGLPPRVRPRVAHALVSASGEVCARRSRFVRTTRSNSVSR